MESFEWFDYPDLIDAPDDLELIEEEEIEDSGDQNGTRLTNSELDVITSRVAESLLAPLQRLADTGSGISTYYAATWQAEAVSLRGMINSSFARINSTDNRLAGAVGNINTNRSTINSLNSTVKSHSSNFVSVKGNVSNLMNWRNGANTKLNQISGLRTDVNSLKTWRTSQTSAFNSLKGTVNVNNTRLNTVESWKAGANSKINSHTTRLDTLESWRKGHDTWAGNLSKRVDSLQSWKDTHNTWAGNQSKRIDSLESWKSAFVGTQNELNTNQNNRLSQIENKMKVKIVNNVDMNSLVDTGLYRIQKATKNYPANKDSWWCVRVEKYSEGNGAVLQTAYLDYSPNVQYQRSHNASNGTWTAWTKLADENDIKALTTKDTQLNTKIEQEISDRKKEDSSITSMVNALKAADVTQGIWNTTQSNRITKIEDKLKVRVVDKVDMNSLTETALYRVQKATANYPANQDSWWCVRVEHFSEGNGAVLQTAYLDYSPNVQYQRSRNASSGMWTAWTKLADENDIKALTTKDTQLNTKIEQEISDRKKEISSIDSSINILKAADVTQGIWNTNQSNRITNIEDKLKVRIVNNVDMNSLTDTALYRVQKATANYPANQDSWWCVRVERYSEGNGAVLQTAYLDYSPNVQYQRSRNASNGTWTAWTKLADENDLKLLTTSIEKESSERKAADGATALSIMSMKQDLNDINDRIDQLKFSDVGIIAAIVASMKSNENLWNADNYDGGSVGANDGKAVKLFKNQFQGLKTHYAAIMRTYFDMDDKNSSIYRLRYSIVAGFEETKALLTEWFTHLLKSSNTTNSHLNSVNTWLKLQDAQFKEIYEALCIITDWLELIYQKPPPVVNVTIPPIKLDEAGNGWLKTLIKTVGDVMKTAIETLGSLLEAAIGEVGQLLRDLLEFFDGLLDDLLHLIVPENLDFMDRKFDSTSKTIKLKFGSIFDGIDSFKSLLSGKSQFKDIEINLGSFGNGSFKIPVSILNTLAPFVYPLITGAVALEFLIDMYKWFHTKGEVIE